MSMIGIGLAGIVMFGIIFAYAWSIDNAYTDTEPKFLNHQMKMHRNHRKMKQEKRKSKFQK